MPAGAAEGPLPMPMGASSSRQRPDRWAATPAGWHRHQMQGRPGGGSEFSRDAYKAHVARQNAARASKQNQSCVRAPSKKDAPTASRPLAASPPAPATVLAGSRPSSSPPAKPTPPVPVQLTVGNSQTRPKARVMREL